MEVEVSDGLNNSEKYTIELTINEPVAEVIFEDIDEIAEDLTEEVEEEVNADFKILIWIRSYYFFTHVLLNINVKLFLLNLIRPYENIRNLIHIYN